MLEEERLAAQGEEEYGEEEGEEEEDGEEEEEEEEPEEMKAVVVKNSPSNFSALSYEMFVAETRVGEVGKKIVFFGKCFPASDNPPPRSLVVVSSPLALPSSIHTCRCKTTTRSWARWLARWPPPTTPTGWRRRRSAQASTPTTLIPTAWVRPAR